MKKKKSVLKRTAEASKKKRLLAIEKKLKKQKEFDEVWRVLFQKKSQKKELQRALKGNYQNLSCSLNEICRTANTLGIKTINGKSTWQRIQVRRLLFVKSVYDGHEINAQSTLDKFLK